MGLFPRHGCTRRDGKKRKSWEIGGRNQDKGGGAGGAGGGGGRIKDSMKSSTL